MATIKSFTNIEQSTKLAEILPIESADMYWYLATKGNPVAGFNEGYNKYGDFELPCWSLASLLNVMPFWYDIHPVKNGVAIKCDYGKEEIVISSNAVDACVEMIIKLHELNLL